MGDVGWGVTRRGYEGRMEVAFLSVFGWGFEMGGLEGEGREDFYRRGWAFFFFFFFFGSHWGDGGVWIGTSEKEGDLKEFLEISKSKGAGGQKQAGDDQQLPNKTQACSNSTSAVPALQISCRKPN